MSPFGFWTSYAIESRIWSCTFEHVGINLLSTERGIYIFVAHRVDSLKPQIEWSLCQFHCAGRLEMNAQHCAIRHSNLLKQQVEDRTRLQLLYCFDIMGLWFDGFYRVNSQNVISRKLVASSRTNPLPWL